MRLRWLASRAAAAAGGSSEEVTGGPRSEPGFSHEEAPGPHANFRTVRVFKQSVTVSREVTALPGHFRRQYSGRAVPAASG